MLPETGVDLTAWVPVLLSGLGVIIAAAVGGGLAMLLVRKGVAWVAASLEDGGGSANEGLSAEEVARGMYLDKDGVPISRLESKPEDDRYALSGDEELEMDSKRWER